MNILGIETSSTWGSVAIVKDDRLVFSTYLDIKLTHSERLLPQIDYALNQSKIKLGELDLIAVSNGPGSFTGVRIGLAAAKGLCFPDEIPVYPVNTLRLLAANLYGNKYPILPFIDARMQQVYAAIYDHELIEIIAPCCTDPLEFLSKIDQKVTIIGNGVDRYEDLIKENLMDFSVVPLHQSIPTAQTLVSLALYDKPDLEFNFQFISSLEPYYLRKSQAELNKNKEKK